MSFGIYTFVEYLKFKKTILRKEGKINFQKYLKTKLKRKTKNEQVILPLKDETLDKLEEIIDENELK